MQEADKLRHQQIGPEHLLLGMLSEGQSLAARVLAEVGLSLQEVRDYLEKRETDGEMWT